MKTHLDLPRLWESRKILPHYVAQSASNSGVTFVYFSSNAIYFPNDPQTFQKAIFDQDRFEWKRSAVKDLPAVFVRDVLKQWYILGINDSTDSLEKLAKLILKLAGTNKIRCVGSSSGGYAAIAVGILVKAECCFCFSSQFDLNEVLKTDSDHLENPILSNALRQNPAHPWVDLRNRLEESAMPVLYLYPAGCMDDLVQAEGVRHLPNVSAIAVASDLHGDCCQRHNYPKLFRMDPADFRVLAAQFAHRAVSKRKFSVVVSGLLPTLFLEIMLFWQKVRRRLINFRPGKRNQ